MFKDHFSNHASSYAVYRPTSPDELFDFLASVVKHRRVAWDVGTGNGQAALTLVRYFDKVFATDASSEQIANAKPHPQITYGAAPAEDTRLITEKVDLITVAQAIHWFDFEKFYEAVRKVAQPEAVLAAWTYALTTVNAEIDEVILEYYQAIDAYWPPERKLVDAHYQTIPFPFQEIPAPPFKMEFSWDLPTMVGYLKTWSGTQRAIKQLGEPVFSDFVQKLQARWGSPETVRTVAWPMFMRVGRVFS